MPSENINVGFKLQLHVVSNYLKCKMARNAKLTIMVVTIVVNELRGKSTQAMLSNIFAQFVQ